jgi:hypothetical protein
VGGNAVRDINVLPTWLYGVWGQGSSEYLYAGVTCNLRARLTQHRDAKPWWPEADYVIATLFPDREQALTWEAVEIRDARPRYNRETPPQPVIHDGWNPDVDYLRCVEFVPQEVSWLASAR